MMKFASLRSMIADKVTSKVFWVKVLITTIFVVSLLSSAAGADPEPDTWGGG